MLIRDVRLGARSHREHERLVGEAEAIGGALRAVFREPTRAQPAPHHPPLFIEGGKGIW